MEPEVEPDRPDLPWLCRTLAALLEDEIARPRQERDSQAIVRYTRVLQALLTKKEAPVRADSNPDENLSAADNDDVAKIRAALRTEIRAGAGNVSRGTIP
jgi:hypothetical protein